MTIGLFFQPLKGQTSSVAPSHIVAPKLHLRHQADREWDWSLRVCRRAALHLGNEW